MGRLNKYMDKRPERINSYWTHKGNSNNFLNFPQDQADWHINTTQYDPRILALTSLSLLKRKKNKAAKEVK